VKDRLVFELDRDDCCYGCPALVLADMECDEELGLIRTFTCSKGVFDNVEIKVDDLLKRPTNCPIKEI
jgi:hypothetical protein